MYIRGHAHHPLIVPYLYAFLLLQGILDMLVLSQPEAKNDLIIHALKNNFEADAYFVKVMGKWLISPVSSVPVPPLHMSKRGHIVNIRDLFPLATVMTQLKFQHFMVLCVFMYYSPS